jgi:hypothetical protein
MIALVPIKHPPFIAAASLCPPFCGPQFFNVYDPAVPHVSPELHSNTHVFMSVVQLGPTDEMGWPLMVTSLLTSTVPHCPYVNSNHVFLICPNELSVVSGYTAAMPPEMSSHEICTESPAARGVVMSGGMPEDMNDAEYPDVPHTTTVMGTPAAFLTVLTFGP